MHKALVTTVPFGAIDPEPLDLLHGQQDMETVVNPMGRRLTAAELGDMIAGVTVLIAGTEPITQETLEMADKLQSDGVKIGMSTGFIRPMVDVLLAHANEQGFHPDCTVAVDEVRLGANDNRFFKSG